MALSDNELERVIGQNESLIAKREVCLAKVAETDARLKQVVRKNPQAVAEYLHLNLLMDDEGNVLRNRDGSIKGYMNVLWPVHDRDLANEIEKARREASKGCRTQR